MRAFQAPDGSRWNVDVKLPSHSSALLTFQNALGQSVAPDRYAWINVDIRKTTDPRERLSAKPLLEAMTDDDLARSFRRSMAVGRA